jgi:hypothetical protein
MKKETVEKSNKILKDKESIDEVIDRLIIGDEFGKKGYRYLEQISIRTYELGVQTRNCEIPLSQEGNITLKKPLSDHNMDILAYLVKSFHHSVLQLFIAQAEELQREFDNLKD